MKSRQFIRACVFVAALMSLSACRHHVNLEKSDHEVRYVRQPTYTSFKSRIVKHRRDIDRFYTIHEDVHRLKVSMINKDESDR